MGGAGGTGWYADAAPSDACEGDDCKCNGEDGACDAACDSSDAAWDGACEQDGGCEASDTDGAGSDASEVEAEPPDVTAPD